VGWGDRRRLGSRPAGESWTTCMLGTAADCQCDDLRPHIMPRIEMRGGDDAFLVQRRTACISTPTMSARVN